MCKPTLARNSNPNNKSYHHVPKYLRAVAYRFTGKVSNDPDGSKTDVYETSMNVSVHHGGAIDLVTKFIGTTDTTIHTPSNANTDKEFVFRHGTQLLNCNAQI